MTHSSNLQRGKISENDWIRLCWVWTYDRNRHVCARRAGSGWRKAYERKEWAFGRSKWAEKKNKERAWTSLRGCNQNCVNYPSNVCKNTFSKLFAQTCISLRGRTGVPQAVHIRQTLIWQQLKKTKKKKKRDSGNIFLSIFKPYFPNGHCCDSLFMFYVVKQTSVTQTASMQTSCDVRMRLACDCGMEGLARLDEGQTLLGLSSDGSVVQRLWNLPCEYQLNLT